MIDIKHKKCIACNLFRADRKPYLCSYCNPASSSRQKTSEMILYNFLTEEKIQFIHNKSVGYVCGDYRPDFLIDCATHFIVIENDEDQHRQYPKECEMVRMRNIEFALGLKTHFIRYNPDAHKINGKTKRVSRKKRMEALLLLIEKLKLSQPDDNLENNITYLYYDS